MNTLGPKYSSTLANDASYGSSTWDNIVSTPNTNAWNASRADCYNIDVGISNYLKLTNFGFSIPTGSTILGITVEIYAFSVNGTERFSSCKIVKNNVIVGTDKSDNSIITPTKTFGNSADLWGTTWTAADISSSNFGVVFSAQGYSAGSGVVSYGARITINYLSSRQSYTATGTLTLSKAGVINEDFSANLNNFQQTNSDAGYAINTGSGMVGDGSGGLSYSGFLTRSDAYPSGYASPAILFAPCSPNFTAEMKFLTPNNSTGSLTPITISLFYRVKDSNNYRAINLKWERNAGTDLFSISDELKLSGVSTHDTWFGVDLMEANQESYIIFKFRVVNDKMTIVFNNLNTLSTVTAEKTLLLSPSSLSKEGGVGLGFDSDQKLISINSLSGSTSFKPDYFKAYNIPYENLNKRFVSSGQLTLSGSPSTKLKLKQTATGQLTLGGTALTKYKSKYRATATGQLILAGHSYEFTSGSFVPQPSHEYIADGNLTVYGASGTNCSFISTDYGVKFYSSPILVFGITLPTANFSYIASEGLTLSGTSLASIKKLNFKDSFNDGLVLSGNALANYFTKYTYISTGSLILSGDALTDYKNKYNINATGGLILSGDSTQSYFTKYIYNSTGGMILSGSALTNYFNKYNYISEGGLILAGDYARSYYYESDGILTLGDSSSSQLSLNASFTGGLILDGTSVVTKSSNYTATGGLIFSSQASYRISTEYRYFPSSGLILSGISLNKLNVKLIGSGNLVLDGTSLVSVKAKYSTQFSGNLILSDSSLQKYSVIYHFVSSGNLILSGNSLQKYSVIYNLFSGGTLIIGDSSLYKYSVIYGNLGSVLNLRLTGKAKNKKRELVNNYSYTKNNSIPGEVELVRTKKDDKYLNWKYKNDAVISD